MSFRSFLAAEPFEAVCATPRVQLRVVALHIFSAQVTPPIFESTTSSYSYFYGRLNRVLMSGGGSRGREKAYVIV